MLAKDLDSKRSDVHFTNMPMGAKNLFVKNYNFDHSDNSMLTYKEWKEMTER